MNNVKYIKRIFSVMTIVLGLFSGCGTTKNNVQLTEEQEAKVDIICDNVDTWSLGYMEGGITYYPVNRIYVSEYEDGTTFLTVGHLEESSEPGIATYTGVLCYVILDNNFYFLAEGYQSAQWAAQGIEFDNTMDEENVREIVTQSYLNFIN